MDDNNDPQSDGLKKFAEDAEEAKRIADEMNRTPEGRRAMQQNIENANKIMKQAQEREQK